MIACALSDCPRARLPNAATAAQARSLEPEVGGMLWKWSDSTLSEIFQPSGVLTCSSRYYRPRKNICLSPFPRPRTTGQCLTVLALAVSPSISMFAVEMACWMTATRSSARETAAGASQSGARALASGRSKCGRAAVSRSCPWNASAVAMSSRVAEGRPRRSSAATTSYGEKISNASPNASCAGSIAPGRTLCSNPRR
jgi:hypothetical protein